MPSISPANRAALKSLTKIGIIGLGIAMAGGLAWKVNVHDKQMNIVDSFYKKP